MTNFLIRTPRHRHKSKKISRKKSKPIDTSSPLPRLRNMGGSADKITAKETKLAAKLSVLVKTAMAIRGPRSGPLGSARASQALIRKQLEALKTEIALAEKKTTKAAQ